MSRTSEYEVELRFIERLESIGYDYADLTNYADVILNFRDKITEFNKVQLVEAKGEATLSDAEFSRIMNHLDNKSVYESAKLLRDKYVLPLDNGKTVYLDFFSFDTDRINVVYILNLLRAASKGENPANRSFIHTHHRFILYFP